MVSCLAHYYISVASSVAAAFGAPEFPSVFGLSSDCSVIFVCFTLSSAL